ncbi:hypothetical protein LTR28_006470 [Elasticomyces elasticus]|nr:hypothetical protein LTR28_006470 [Elasticomyces elasticus]
MPSMGPASVEIGSFAYSDPDQYQTPSSPHKAPRKRKLETDGSDNHRSPAKRPSMQQFPSQAGEQTLAYPTRATTTTTAHASPFYQSAMPESYDYQRGYSYQQNQRVANPPLIRTSTLQPSPPTTTRSAGIAHGFGSYATMYPSNAKASLKIEGELGTMAEHWTHDEFEARRRLVQFRRSQAGSIITTSFEAVTPEERSPNSICISCIWWEQKQEAFVTSVDTIYLLESLVAVRFTVEEKNRIRRNLEGFRPLTVSKAKPESEEFFKTIMGFPNPKPRNIEKDVKVFPWRILAHALKKIIGKYSASYSSTASAFPASPAMAYGTGRPADATPDHRPVTSPRSASSSAASAYACGMTTAPLTHSLPASAAMGDASAHPSGLRPALAISGSGAVTSWHDASYYAAAAGLPMGGGRASWDFAQYMDPEPHVAAGQQIGGGGGGAQAATSYYPRLPSVSQMSKEESQFLGAAGYQDYGQRITRA